MLGVQAWIAAPFYWLGGPTVAMLRMPLLIINAVVAVWLLRAIARSTGSAYLALAAVLPLAAATPVLSANLIDTLGASVDLAARITGNARRWWRNSCMGLNRALPVGHFDRLGVPRFS